MAIIRLKFSFETLSGDADDISCILGGGGDHSHLLEGH